LLRPILKSKGATGCRKTNLTYTAVTAAIDGQVLKIDIQPGQLVQPDSLILYHQ
jgi:membrane fusion protein (multidrug efflux system)